MSSRSGRPLMQPSRLFGAAACVAVAVYAAVTVWNNLASPLVIASAAQMTLRSEVSAGAYVVREEICSGSGFMYIIPDRSDGEMVTSGAAVATAYTGGDADAARELMDISAAISVLTEAQAMSDSKKQDSLKQSLRSLAAAVAHRDTAAANAIAVTVESLTGFPQDVSFEISRLEADASALAAKLENPTVLTASHAGVVHYSCDGYEHISIDDIRSLTPSSIDYIFSDKRSTDGVKLLTDYKWYLAAIVSAADARAMLGRSVSVSVPRFSTSVYNMKAESIGPEEDGMAVVILSSSDHITDTLDSRYADIRITVGETSGYAVPRAAVRYETDETGLAYIYVADVYQARRVRVNVVKLADDDTYLVTPFVFQIPDGADADVKAEAAKLQREYDSGPGMLLRDGMEVIIRGRSLADGKVIRS